MSVQTKDCHVTIARALQARPCYRCAQKQVSPSDGQTLMSESHPCVTRDFIKNGSGYQNGGIFGKVLKAEGFKNLYCKFWTFTYFFSGGFPKKMQYKGHLEIFRKFIRFGTATRPLP